jgi:signal peptidase I
MKKNEVLQLIIVLIIAVFLINTLIPFVNGSEKPMIVLSGSMVPFFLPGDMIIEKSVSPNELKAGDVITFQLPGAKPGMLITHRIISIEGREERIFQTKGDANGGEDYFKVPESNVVGKLVFVIPLVGYLPDYFKRNISYFLLLVILPACLLIIGEIKDLILYSNPARARKVERERKKVARRTSYVIKGKRLVALILISGFVFTGIVAFNLGENGSVILQSENKIDNSGFLPIVYTITPNNSAQILDIHSWYGVLSPANESQVIAPENTAVLISTVPYILPVFWIVVLAKINPNLPAVAEIVIYTSAVILILSPIWYKKSIIGRHKKRTSFRRRLAKWKRTIYFR